MTYYTPLKLDLPLLMPHVREETGGRWIHGRLNIDSDIQPGIEEFFAKFNLRIVLVETFYSPPYYKSRPHSDSHGGDIGKINWVFGGTGSKMEWHKVKESETRTASGSNLSDISTEFMLFRPDQTESIYQAEIHSPSIVQVGTPHCVANSSEARWCVSLAFVDLDTGKQATYTKLVELFSEYRA